MQLLASRIDQQLYALYSNGFSILLTTGFLGKLRSAIYRPNLNVYYFQVAEYVKYHRVYKDPFLAQLDGRCPSDTINSTDNETLLENENDSENETVLDSRVISQMESGGLLRVYAKCPLKANKTYFVSTTLHFTKNGRPRLIMCCQHNDEHYALNYLTNLLHDQECCRYSQYSYIVLSFIFCFSMSLCAFCSYIIPSHQQFLCILVCDQSHFNITHTVSQLVGWSVKKSPLFSIFITSKHSHLFVLFYTVCASQHILLPLPSTRKIQLIIILHALYACIIIQLQFQRVCQKKLQG